MRSEVSFTHHRFLAGGHISSMSGFVSEDIHRKEFWGYSKPEQRVQKIERKISILVILSGHNRAIMYIYVYKYRRLNNYYEVQ